MNPLLSRIFMSHDFARRVAVVIHALTKEVWRWRDSNRGPPGRSRPLGHAATLNNSIYLMFLIGVFNRTQSIYLPFYYMIIY